MTEEEKMAIMEAAMAGKPLPEPLRATFVWNVNGTFSPAVVMWPSMTPHPRCQSHRCYLNCRWAITDAEDQLRGIIRRATR
jgi:hypothetical protein